MPSQADRIISRLLAYSWPLTLLLGMAAWVVAAHDRSSDDYELTIWATSLALSAPQLFYGVWCWRHRSARRTLVMLGGWPVTVFFVQYVMVWLPRPVDHPKRDGLGSVSGVHTPNAPLLGISGI